MKHAPPDGPESDSRGTPRFDPRPVSGRSLSCITCIICIMLIHRCANGRCLIPVSVFWNKTTGASGPMSEARDANRRAAWGRADGVASRGTMATTSESRPSETLGVSILPTLFSLFSPLAGGVTGACQRNAEPRRGGDWEIGRLGERREKVIGRLGALRGSGSKRQVPVEEECSLRSLRPADLGVWECGKASSVPNRSREVVHGVIR